jgi:hypothetical protein
LIFSITRHCFYLALVFDAELDIMRKSQLQAPSFLRAHRWSRDLASHHGWQKAFGG